MRAAEACERLILVGLRSASASLRDVRRIVADVGPGSFTGTRVGVTMAKTLAYANGGEVAGVSAFDLIAPGMTVALPLKKGEWWLRRPGQSPQRQLEQPEIGTLGYGAGFEHPVFPEAARVAAILGKLDWVSPNDLVPHYGVEPSISKPNRAYGPGSGIG